MAVNPAVVIEAIQILTTPDQSVLTPGNPAQAQGFEGSRFDVLLSSCIARLKEKLTSEKFSNLNKELFQQGEINVCYTREITDETSIRWCFVGYCLVLLDHLRRSLYRVGEECKPEVKKDTRKPSSAPQLSPDTLSFGQQKTVLSAVQFVVSLGVCPNLQEGVGIPVARRSEFSHLLMSATAVEELTEREKHWRLYLCVRAMVDCVSNPSLGTLIVSRNLTDLLAALFQLVYTQESGKKVDSNHSNSDTGHGHLNGSPENASTSCEHKVVDGERTAVVLNENLLDAENSADLSPASVVNIVQKRINQTKQDKFDNKGNKAGCLETSETQSPSTETGVAAETSGQGSPGLCQTMADSCSVVEVDSKISSPVDSHCPDYKFCEQAVADLLKKLYPPLLVKTLMILQGAPPQKKNPGAQGKVARPVLAPAPAWLRKLCGMRLTDIIMGPKGVQSVLRGMLEGHGGGGQSAASQTADWRKCDAIAKVIACCPKQTTSVEEYYRRVAPQVVELLHIRDKQVARMFLRVACSTVSSMAAQYPDLTRRHVIGPLLQPLTAVTSESDIEMTEDSRVIVDEQRLTDCVEDIHKVFVSGVCNSLSLMDSLRPVLHTVYQLLVFCQRGVSSLKAACHEILIAYLKHADKMATLTCLKLLALEQTETPDKGHQQFDTMHHNAMFASGSSGGVIIVTRPHDSVPETETDDVRVTCMVSLLKDLQKDGSAADFFLYMLQELTSLVAMETEGITDDVPLSQTTGTQPLLEIETQNQTRQEQFYRKLMLLNLLAAVCETLGPDCLTDTQHVLAFAKATLERAVHVCQATSELATEVFESETVSMAMGLLTAVMTGGLQMKSADQKSLEELLPLLQELSSNHPESSVQEMASDLRIAIATHGMVWSEVMKTASGELKDTSKKVKDRSSQVKQTARETRNKVKPKIEEIKDLSNGETGLPQTHPSPDSGAKTGQFADSKSEDKSTVSLEQTNGEPVRETGSAGQQEVGLGEAQPSSELHQAFKELLDPLVPVRGHGLLRLTNLVRTKDPKTMQKKDKIFQIFVENLDHADSYIYLASINGLSALCDVYPDMVLPRICEEFASYQGQKKARKPSVELRMKLGEILMKATKNLGGLVPSFGNLLLNTMLTGTRDEEPVVRASSLSNLGEICRLLHFSLGSCVHEVFLCCSSLLKSDLDPGVRKAAAMALTLLLQGLGDDSISVLATVLKDLYRLLKLVMAVEREEGVRLHANLALNEMDDIMRKHLFPEVKLEKRIRVLDPL